jgi:GNAT superfamily N-acetyltransferase
MIWLGRPLGALLPAHGGQVAFLPEYSGDIFLKPAQQARYVVGLAAAVLLAAATLAVAQRPPRLGPRTAGALVRASQCAGAAFIGVCIWAQRTVAPPPIGGAPVAIQPYFTVPTLLVATLLAVAAAFAAGNDSLRGRLARALSSPHRRVAVIGGAIAVIATAVWVLAGVNFDDTLHNASYNTFYNVKGPLDEAFAVLDGRTPLVNFTATYGFLWPYLTALVMSVLGTSFGVFSVTMCAITGLSLLAIFAVLRRVTGNALAALALYLPFLANGFFAMGPGLVNRWGPITIYALFPLRYAGPYLLAWLVARHLDGARPRRRWMLFLAAGIVVLNNVDFGIAAFGAAFAASLWAEPALRWRGVGRLLRDALAGALAAYALVSALTLARTGSPADLGVLLFYARLYGGSGFGLLPTQTLGLHIVIYLTYVAAIGTATVRAIRGDSGRPLTGLLAWSGVFGLGVGAYYMGRSSPEQLISMFSAWTLALALLTVAVIQQIARNPGRRPTIAHIAVFLGMGAAACSLAQTPAPWTQIERLERTTASTYVASGALKQVLRRYGGGKPEAIMSVIGHREAYEAGIENVSPYLGTLLIVTVQQIENTLRALRDAGGKLLVLPLANTNTNFYTTVCKAGFSFIGQVAVPIEFEAGKPGGLTLWSAPVPGVAPRPCPIS